MATEDPDVLVRLPDENRDAFKEPLGPIATDADRLFSELAGPVITIGDMVSYHAQEAGRIPDVAVVDGRTKRTAVDPDIESALAEIDVARLDATNPPGTVTESLIHAISTALQRNEPAQVCVDGEEDLAAIPAILLAPDGAIVVYGQPDEGMVTVVVDGDARERARILVELFDGNRERLHSLSAG